MLKLNQVNYFVTAIEEGSITKAAKTLYVSQPALSKQLLLLEQELNCQLFQRKTTGLELTDAGYLFYQKAKGILSQTNELLSEMEMFTSENKIRIGTLPSIGSYFLPEFIGKFNKGYKIELIIKDTTEEIIDLLHRNKIDVAYVQDAFNQKDIIIEHLFDEPYDAILPVSSPEGTYINLNSFIKQNIILHKHPCDIRRFFEKYCEGLQFSITLDLDSNESIIPFVANGLGVSILPRMVSSKAPRSSTRIKIFQDGKFKRSIDFLYKPMGKKIAKELLRYTRDYVSIF